MSATELRENLDDLIINLDRLDAMLDLPVGDITVGEYEQKREKLLDEFIQSIATTLGNEESYTRDDVESAFVSGYSLGCLPVGSDPQWDQNEQTVDEHMAELGWVRAATLGAGTCKVESSVAIEFDTLISPDYFEFEMSCGSRFSWSDNEPPDYCPGCGRRVVHGES